MEAFRARFTRFSYARHTHDAYALGTVEEGAMRFWHGGAQHAASIGELIAINPGEVHDGRTGSVAGCRYRMLYVERSALDELFGGNAVRACALKGPVLRDAWLARLMRRIHTALEGGDALEIHAGIAQLLFHLFARYGLPPLAAPDAGQEKRAIAIAKDCITARLGEQLRLTEIAAAAGLSPFYFLRSFKQSTGMPPHAYLNQMRLERARQLLRVGESAAQVAAATGFVDQSHLTRRFKGAFGVTPSQYRAAA